MVAQEIMRPPEGTPDLGPELHVVSPTPHGTGGSIHEAEHSMLRAATIGVLVGMPVGALIWMAIVAIGLALAGGSYDAAAWFGMAAVVGAFAGSFLGGWAGVTATADRMDEVANTPGT